MKLFKFGVFLFLLACTPVTAPSYRNLAAPITSIALFAPEKFAGHWGVVASFDGQACGFDAEMQTAEGFGWRETACSGAVSQTTAKTTGPGRFTPDGGARKGQQHWVMWVDQTYRTAVIGTPDGSFGMILNRGGNIPADRKQAAREILDWNGYDLSKLKSPS